MFVKDELLSTYQTYHLLGLTVFTNEIKQKRKSYVQRNASNFKPLFRIYVLLKIKPTYAPPPTTVVARPDMRP